MYKDAKEELKRLEEALLEEEEDQQAETAEAAETDIDALLEQTKEMLEKSSDETQVFHWSPEELQRSGRVYNADRTDEDLQQFAEQVRDGGKKSLTGWIITAAVLAAGIAAVVIWWIIRYGGAFL